MKGPARDRGFDPFLGPCNRIAGERRARCSNSVSFYALRALWNEEPRMFTPSSDGVPTDPESGAVFGTYQGVKLGVGWPDTRNTHPRWAVRRRSSVGLNCWGKGSTTKRNLQLLRVQYSVRAQRNCRSLQVAFGTSPRRPRRQINGRGNSGRK